jgi:hypothetical protein
MEAPTFITTGPVWIMEAVRCFQTPRFQRSQVVWCTEQNLKYYNLSGNSLENLQPATWDTKVT